MIKKVDHIGIAVKSIEKTLPFYTDVLNLPLIGIEEVETQKVRVAFLQAGSTKLELLEPISEESPIAKFIEKGIRMIDDQPRSGAGGADIAFMHPKSAAGVLFELCEKKGMKG